MQTIVRSEQWTFFWFFVVGSNFSWSSVVLIYLIRSRFVYFGRQGSKKRRKPAESNMRHQYNITSGIYISHKVIIRK